MLSIRVTVKFFYRVNVKVKVKSRLRLCVCLSIKAYFMAKTITRSYELFWVCFYDEY